MTKAIARFAKKYAIITNLVDYLVNHTSSRVITFVDSRKLAEYVTTLLERNQNQQEMDRDSTADEDEENLGNLFINYLQNLNVPAYKADYEEQDAKVTQSRLSQGSARGVISTSALEFGLDIPLLDACVLVGVPQSFTSFFHAKFGFV